MAVTPETRSPLPQADPASAGLDPERIERLYRLIEEHIAEGRYPGAQVAFARHGTLLASRSFGQARIEPSGRPAVDDSLWLLYSQTKVVTAAALWLLLGAGALNGVRLLSPRTVQFVTRNHTGDRIDESFGIPMHRGLGPHVRGTTPAIRGLGAIAAPATFGHGGVGSSYSWADPDSGLSFTYLTNCRSDEPWHTARLDRISNLAHAALVEP